MADAQLVLTVAQSGFTGHLSKDIEIIGKEEPMRGWRATVCFYLYPETRTGRCYAVNLLHPSERNTPRCGSSECRCMLKEEEYEQTDTRTSS